MNMCREKGKRWRATVYYKGTVLPTQVYNVEEIEDLQGLIESGPAWNLIFNIVITYQR